MSPEDSADELVLALYSHLLKRQPSPAELDRWVESITLGKNSISSVVRSFVDSEEFVSKQGVKSIFRPGHFHSPVVDPINVAAYVARERTTEPHQVNGIEIDIMAMRQLWLEELPLTVKSPIQAQKKEGQRYSYEGGPFPWGDGISLRMIIGRFRPHQVVEIGSGFSSACMLDAAEELGIDNFRLLCIDPYPERLRSLLRPADFQRVSIVEAGIQDVAADIVDALSPNDILFIDSTHVLKTGSDVHYELFHLIPRLKPGVLVHFHDVPYPFEYPDKWIFDLNHSWNEAYMLRAFLMYNMQFKILFWGSLLARCYRQELTEEYPKFLNNPGSSIWLHRC